MFDGGAFAVSASGAVQEIGGFAKGFAEGIEASPLVAIAAGLVESAIQNGSYRALRDDFGDGLGYASLVSTFLSDWASGNTYFSQDQIDGKVLVIGSSTQFSFGAAVLGDRHGIAMVDAVVDGAVFYNDVTSLFGGIGPSKPISNQISPLRINIPDNQPAWLPKPVPPPPPSTPR
jgi:hypothetical protein